MEKILVAGATGYLGRYIIKELKRQGYFTIALARSLNKLSELDHFIDKYIEAELTKPETLLNICTDVDCVISTVGITKQKDGLTYMDVDYQANANLLGEALRSNVKKFIYVSVLNAHLMKDLKIIAAKERFVEKLKSSGINYSVIRPNGFFSDMSELLKMAKKGKVYLFGTGEYKGNPIHGEDLAEVIVKNIESNQNEIEIGGPEILTQNEMAKSAFDALNKKIKIKYVPLWIKSIVLKMIRFFTGEKVYGPIEFFLTVMTMDMIAPQYGKYKLTEFYEEVSNEKIKR